jgi:hypothetical protein
MNQISTGPITAGTSNGGSSPEIDPLNGKIVYYTSNPETVRTVDLNNGTVVNSFSYPTGFYPHHFAYNELDSTMYCLMVDQNNANNEYLGTFNTTTGAMTQISTTSTSTALNNGTTPIIDPINRKFIYSNGNPGPVKIIDLDNGNVVNTYNYFTGLFPRHFAYNELDSTIYCMLVDPSNGWKEYFGSFDASTGLTTQISTTIVSSFVNNGTTPVIDPINRKYIYNSSNAVAIKIIDLDNGIVVDSFDYQTGFSPRHFAYLGSKWTTGIKKEENKSTFNLFPNPVASQLTFDTDLTVTSVTIFDLTGKTIKTYKQLSKHINVSALSKGVYFIQVITDKNTITRKFVKQ